jgi:hypothetical protein
LSVSMAPRPTGSHYRRRSPLSLASVCASVEEWNEVLRQRDWGGQMR